MSQLMGMQIPRDLRTPCVGDAGMLFQLFVDRRLTHFSLGANVAGIKHIRRGVGRIPMAFFEVLLQMGYGLRQQIQGADFASFADDRDVRFGSV